MGTLANGIKDIFSTSQTTATHLPVCASDGTPQGRISVGNLASVLGVNSVEEIPANTDLNNIYKQGIYIGLVNSNKATILHKPTDKSGTFLSFVGRSADATHHDSFQLYKVARGDGDDVLYYRSYWFGYGGWSDWHLVTSDMPTFYKNYANLNDLTNALVKQNALSIGNVMVVTNADSYTRFWPADRALESGIASIAVGAGIIENGRTLIIAKDQGSGLKWATSNVTGGTTAISDRRAAIADFDGRAKTTTILATLGDNAPAAKYCNEYYPSNVASTDGNMGAGRWWLPSLGEWAMIWAHVRQVNFVLSAIGGTQIPVGSGWTWSSTETSATLAWYLNTGSGGFGNLGKTDEGSVRPVSAFY